MLVSLPWSVSGLKQGQGLTCLCAQEPDMVPGRAFVFHWCWMNAPRKIKEKKPFNCEVISYWFIHLLFLCSLICITCIITKMITYKRNFENQPFEIQVTVFVRGINYKVPEILLKSHQNGIKARLACQVGLLILSSDTKFIYGICCTWKVISNSCMILHDFSCQELFCWLIVISLICTLIFLICALVIIFFILLFPLSWTSWVWWY